MRIAAAGLASVCLLAAGSGIPARGQSPAGGQESREEVFSDSLAREFRVSLRRFKTVELAKRVAARRAIQRNGYCRILAGVIQHDALGALFSYIRMRLFLDFSLPQDQLVVCIPSQYRVETIPGVPPVVGAPNAMTVVPLYEDRSFPPDPWKKEEL